MKRRSSSAPWVLVAVLPGFFVAACARQQPDAAVPEGPDVPAERAETEAARASEAEERASEAEERALEAEERASEAEERALEAEERALEVAQVAEGTGQDQVLVGRELVLHHGCGDCHGGADNPAAPGWLAGWRPDFPPGVGQYVVGPFTTYARNLTPDNATGMGRFSELQIFNALRYGLRPGETPDMEIVAQNGGAGNFPVSPKYLAPPMPWYSFRHMSDEELRAIAAYLKRGLHPVENRVPDSDGPPDFWAETYAQMIGEHPAPAFPTENEKRPADNERPPE